MTQEKMSPATKAWLGFALVLAAMLIYYLRGLPGGLDMLWHGGIFGLGLGLMLPQFFPGTSAMVIAAVRDFLSRRTGGGTPGL